MASLKFLLPAFAVFTIACSKSDESSEPVYKLTDTFITTSCENEANTCTSIEGFYMVSGFNMDDECLLTDETYASFEMYSDNRLSFMGEHADLNGTLHMTKETIWLFNSLPWVPAGTNSEHDLYQYLPVTASSEGEFEFAIKFYQPGSNEYFITRRYRLKLWMDGHFLRAKTTKADLPTY